MPTEKWNVGAHLTSKKPVGCKWVFSIKYNADQSMEWYKARLEAKGNTQTYEVDH